MAGQLRVDISLVECQQCATEFSDPETKQQLSVWKHKDSPPPKTFRMNPSAGKIMPFHYTPEASCKRSAARFREVGGAL
jgi:hypothetical protein